MSEDPKVHIHRLERPKSSRFRGLNPEHMTPEQKIVHVNCLHAFTVMAGQYGYSLEKMAIETLKERYPGVPESKLLDSVTEVSVVRNGVPGSSVASLLVQAIVLLATWDVLEDEAAAAEPVQLPDNMAEILAQLPDQTCSKDGCSKPGTHAILMPPPREITELPPPPGLAIAFAAFISCIDHVASWEEDRKNNPAIQIVPLKKEKSS